MAEWPHKIGGVTVWSDTPAYPPRNGFVMISMADFEDLRTEAERWKKDALDAVSALRQVSERCARPRGVCFSAEEES